MLLLQMGRNDGNHPFFHVGKHALFFSFLEKAVQTSIVIPYIKKKVFSCFICTLTFGTFFFEFYTSLTLCANFLFSFLKTLLSRLKENSVPTFLFTGWLAFFRRFQWRLLSSSFLFQPSWPSLKSFFFFAKRGELFVASLALGCFFFLVFGVFFLKGFTTVFVSPSKVVLITFIFPFSLKCASKAWKGKNLLKILHIYAGYFGKFRTFPKIKSFSLRKKIRLNSLLYNKNHIFPSIILPKSSKFIPSNKS